jgi:hypothetical protein
MLDVTLNDTTRNHKKYFLVDSISGDTHNFKVNDNDQIIRSAKALAIKIHEYKVENTPPTTPSNPVLVAKPTSSTVLVNGKNIAFDAYNIGDNNYFKLRDIAYVLSGTEKQFDVGWDSANNTISLTSGKAYTLVGSEMQGKDEVDKTAAPTSSKVYLDGIEASFIAYNIDDANYFKLRDIGEAFDFGVDWDGTRNTIVIDTGKDN